MAIGWAGQRAGSHPSTLAERMVCAPWAAELESRTPVEADNRRITNPLPGEPDAGNPPVRFGGRGGAKPAIPTPIHSTASFRQIQSWLRCLSSIRMTCW